MMGMMSEDLCDQHHGYDTGIFDSMIRSLLSSLGGSSGSHPEPLDNFLTVVVIWFLFGVVLVLVIGVVLLVVLDRVSGGEDDDEYFYDEEKRVPLLDASGS